MRKVFAILGIVFSIVLVVFGLTVIGGDLGGSPSQASGGSYLYTSGYAKFGADFYTYVSNNAADAASAGRTTANNVYELFHLVKQMGGLLMKGLGLLMIGLGLMGTCFFGLELDKARQAVTAQPAPLPASEPQAEPALQPDREPEVQPEAEEEAEPEAQAEPEKPAEPEVQPESENE